MSKQRSVRIARILFGLAIAAVGFVAVETLTSGVIPTTRAICADPGNCTPASPAAYCSNNHVYANICAANADCQYNCCLIGVDPDCPDPR